MEEEKGEGVKGSVSVESSESPRKPGRPRRLTATDEAFHRNLAPGRSHRTHLEHFYSGRAVAALGPDAVGLPEPYRWLLGEGKVRSTILAELGRIEDEELLRFVAAEVCRSRPSAREARERIRWIRTGRQTIGSCEGLLVALRGSLNRYLAGHRNMSLAAAEEALETLLGDVREARAKKDRTGRPPR